MSEINVPKAPAGKPSICEIASEFAPPGTRAVVQGVCRHVLGQEKVITHEDKGITCFNETDWWGNQKNYCVPKGEK